MSTFHEINIPVPWGNVVAKAWNDSGGQPVLMVHGLLDNAGSFDTLVPLLPKTLYYVAIDMPGHGKSSHLFQGLPTKFFDYVLTIDYIADYFNWNKLIFLGHSAGGYVGYFYCAIFPDRVTKFIALEEPVRVFKPKNGALNLLIAYGKLKETERRAALGGVVYSYEDALQRIMVGHPEGISVRSAEVLAERGLVKCGNGYKFRFDQRLKHPELSRMTVEQSIELLKRIKCPLLQIAATDSLARGKMKEDYEESEPIRVKFKSNLRDFYHFRVVEGTHNVHMDYPERVSGLVSEFLTKGE